MSIFAVTTARGPAWDPTLVIRHQRDWTAHADFAEDLVRRGVIVLGGPLDGGAGPDLALIAVEALDEAAVRGHFALDPWTLNGVFQIKDVRAWSWWLDGRRSS